MKMNEKEVLKKIIKKAKLNYMKLISIYQQIKQPKLEENL